MPTAGVESRPSWARADLRNPVRVLAVLLALVASTIASQFVACNAHELGHVVAALPLGWEVETIHWCTPSGGGVEYSHVGVWAGNVQGYIGGLVGAAVLATIYILLIARRARPLRSPEWWFAGLGTVVWIGPQIVIALMEGSAGPNEDYTQLFDGSDIYGFFIVIASVLVGAGYAWRWRRVFSSG